MRKIIYFINILLILYIMTMCIIHIISANIGNIDNFNINEEILNNNIFTINNILFEIHYYYYTDELVTKYANNIINIKNKYMFNFNNRVKAKYYKFQHHNIDIHKNADYIIWIDASFKILNIYDFIYFLLDKISDNDICVFHHSNRKNIYEESNYIINNINNNNYLKIRYNEQEIKFQINEYDLNEFKSNELFELGIFIKKNKNNILNEMFDKIWIENIKHTIQDQISFPYIYNMYKDDIKLNIITDLTIYNGIGYIFINHS